MHLLLIHEERVVHGIVEVFPQRVDVVPDIATDQWSDEKGDISLAE